MKTMTTVTGIDASPSGATVVTVLGGEKLGTRDEALGSKAQAIFANYPEHCMCEIEYDVRDGKLYLTGIEYIEAPEELGGPPETPTGAASTAEESGQADAESVEPPFTLEGLLSLAERVDALEQWAVTQGFKL